MLGKTGVSTGFMGDEKYYRRIPGGWRRSLYKVINIRRRSVGKEKKYGKEKRE